MEPENEADKQQNIQKELESVNSETSENEQSIDSADEIGIPQQKKMYILGEGINNQTLMVPLFPTQSVWTKGEVIFANRQFSLPNRRDLSPLVEEFKHFFRHVRFPLKKIHNNGRDLAYCCLRRKGGGGKIMFIDSKVYEEDFYVDYDKILTVNLDSHEYTMTRHNDISLRKIAAKEEKNLYMTLQANHGNIIVEKTLDGDQKLYLNNAEILAMSSEIAVNRERGNLVLSGKGFVFFQNRTTTQIQKAMLTALLLILFLLILISSSI